MSPYSLTLPRSSAIRLVCLLAVRSLGCSVSLPAPEAADASVPEVTPPRPRPDAGREPEPDAGREPEHTPSTPNKPDAGLDPDPEPTTDAGSTPKVDAGSEPDPEPTPEPQPDPEPAPEPQPDPEPTPEPQPDPEPTPEPQPDPEPTPDPEPGPAAPSCDADLTSDPEHCGQCETRCEADADAIADCVDGRCVAYRSGVQPPAWTDATAGNPGGGLTDYPRPCDAGELLVGLTAITDGVSCELFNIAPICARPQLVAYENDELGVHYASARQLGFASDIVAEAGSVERDLLCADGEAVTRIGVLNGPITIGDQTYTTITRLHVECSHIAFDWDKQLTLSAAQVLDTDPSNSLSGTPHEPALSCPAGHVVTGLRGRAGGGLDSLELQCAELRMN
ncbi:MAG: hypothetical protein ABW321_31465 [Polyangiales bacterium]